MHARTRLVSRRFFLVALALLDGNVARAAPPASPPAGPPAARLVGAALLGGQSFAIVQSLTDRVGPRLAGSAGAEHAVEWALAKMREVGLRNVHREPVKLTRWLRGDASAELVVPLARSLAVTALGRSVPTDKDGLEAEVLVVSSVEELKAIGDRVKGRIVLYDKPMVRSPHFDGYAAVAPLRRNGAVEAARLGAVAALIRSVGTGNFRLPHTGAIHYEEDVRQIPFAALAAEDVDLIGRLSRTGETVRLRLKLGCSQGGEVESANVVGEIAGREKPDEVAVLGAHLDSWDLGAGAIDDGAGCAIVLETARLINVLGLRPRRTLRVVLFMNEEYGLDGALAYGRAHEAELAKHAVAMEADAGAGRPLGFGVVGGTPAALAQLRVIAAPLGALHADSVTASEDGGADLIPMQFLGGVPVVSLSQDVSSYFDWHHTAADTLDKIDPFDLALATASFAVVAYGLADDPRRLPMLPKRPLPFSVPPAKAK